MSEENFKKYERIVLASGRLTSKSGVALDKEDNLLNVKIAADNLGGKITTSTKLGFVAKFRSKEDAQRYSDKAGSMRGVTRASVSGNEVVVVMDK